MSITPFSVPKNEWNIADIMECPQYLKDQFQMFKMWGWHGQWSE